MIPISQMGTLGLQAGKQLPPSHTARAGLEFRSSWPRAHTTPQSASSPTALPCEDSVSCQPRLWSTVGAQ